MSSSKSTQTSLMPECEGLSQEWLFMKGAHELQADGILVDVVLIVDGVKLPACHKFVLAASSPYFRAMFSHGMVEQEKREIDINEVDRRSLELVIDYLYTAHILIGDDNVQGLMTTCSLLQITGLYGKCRDYMIRRLDVTNCLSVYQFARSLYCTKLEEEAFRIIARRFSDICNSVEFFALSKSELIDIISSDDLWISEEERVYEAALMWLSTDSAERGRYIAEIFSHVRFSLIDEKYLNTCIMGEELILSFSQLRAQIDAAKLYLANKKAQLPSPDAAPSVANEDFEKENEERSNATVHPMDMSAPSYHVPVEGVDTPVRIPLNVTPRTGMSTKEFLLFTNGRKTFVTNPESCAEYYGCIDGKRPKIDPNSSAVCMKNQVSGFSPEVPLMKNPEAYVTTCGTTYLLGGLEVEKTPSTNIRTRVYTLQPDTLEWIACAALPNPRCMAAYGDGCGRFYVLGGKAISLGEVISTVHRYDRIENQWEETRPMPIAVYGHAAASLKDEIYVIGGKTATKELLSNVYSMNCHNHQWTELAHLSVPRFLHGVSTHPESDSIYVVGGSSKDGVLDSVEVYNLNNGKWRFGESFPGNRCAQFITFMNNQLHAVGGYVTERNNDNGRYESREMHDVFYYDSSENQWKRKVRRIKGKTSGSLACVKVLLNMSNVPRARITAE